MKKREGVQNLAAMLVSVRDKSKNAIQELMDRFPQILFTSRFRKLERKTGYSRAWILVAAIVSIFTLILATGGWQLLAKLGGFIVPAHSSFKAIDMPGPRPSPQWLSYWIIVAFIGVLEPLLGHVVALGYMYHIIKLCFIVWLYNPATLGASVVYETVLRPYVVTPLLGPLPRPGGPASAANALGGAGGSRRGLVPAIPSAVVVEDEETTDQQHKVLNVYVESAEELPVMEDGAVHPYCLVCVREKNYKGTPVSSKYKTKTGLGLSASWNELVQCDIVTDDVKDLVLVCTVCSRTGLGKDPFIGRVTIPVPDIMAAEEEFSKRDAFHKTQAGKMDGKYELKDQDSENPVGVAGFLKLSFPSLRAD